MATWVPGWKAASRKVHEQVLSNALQDGETVLHRARSLHVRRGLAIVNGQALTVVTDQRLLILRARGALSRLSWPVGMAMAFTILLSNSIHPEMHFSPEAADLIRTRAFIFSVLVGAAFGYLVPGRAPSVVFAAPRWPLRIVRRGSVLQVAGECKLTFSIPRQAKNLERAIRQVTPDIWLRGSSPVAKKTPTPAAPASMAMETASSVATAPTLPPMPSPSGPQEPRPRGRRLSRTMAEVVGLIIIVTASAAFVVSQGHDRADAGPTDSPPKAEPEVVVDSECASALVELRSHVSEMRQILDETYRAYNLADHRWDKADALTEGTSQLFVFEVKIESLAAAPSELATARSLLEASVDEYQYFLEQWALGWAKEPFDPAAESHYDKGTQALDTARAEMYPTPC